MSYFPYDRQHCAQSSKNNGKDNQFVYILLIICRGGSRISSWGGGGGGGAHLKKLCRAEGVTKIFGVLCKKIIFFPILGGGGGGGVHRVICDISV